MRTITIAALLVGLTTLGASAQAPSVERRYEGFTAGAGRLFWRLDTLTGEVSACLPDGLDTPVPCTPWGDGTARRAPKAPPLGLLTDDDVFGSAPKDTPNASE